MFILNVRKIVQSIVNPVGHCYGYEERYDDDDDGDDYNYSNHNHDRNIIIVMKRVCACRN